MVSRIDETELARLEALACAAGAGDYSAHDDADDSAKFAAAACNAVPALVAEVRRLREDRAAMLRDMDAVKTKAEPCDDCWTIYMLMREMGIEEKNLFHRDVCARLKAMQNAEEENAALREKVEAWEWWEEVQNYSCIEHPHHRFRFMDAEMDPRAKAYANAMSEYNKIYFSAHEAVHADRE